MKARAAGYRSGSRTVRSEILETVCAVTGFNRDYARRALKAALTLCVSLGLRHPPPDNQGPEGGDGDSPR